MNPELANYIENSKAQLRKGILEFCVLLSISKQEMYASDILTTLKSHDLLVVEGTIYPILSRLKEANLLHYKWVESKEGPPRKYYSLTEKGKELLTHLTQNYTTLSQSINQLINNHEKND